MYNLLKRQAEVELLPMAHAEQLAVFPYSPLAAGLLSGKYSQSDAPNQGRMLSNKSYQARYADPAYPRIVAEFTAVARRAGVHPASLAIAWVAKHPAVTAPLISARSLEQLEPCLAAASLDLSDEVYAELSALSPAPPPATDRTEEGGPHQLAPR